MSEEQLKSFLEKVKTDTNLQEKLKASMNAADVVALAKTVGFSISETDAIKMQSETLDHELEGVAGGIVPGAIIAGAALASVAVCV